MSNSISIFHLIANCNEIFNAELTQALREIKPKLIEAFVNIYGKKHEDYIRYTIENISFNYFICEKLIRKALEEKLPPKERNIIKKYLIYLKNIKNACKKVPDAKKRDFILERLITKLDIPECFLEKDMILESLLEDCPMFNMLLNSNQKYLKYILLPLYTITIEIIFHEINHALSLDAIGYDEESIILTSPFTTPESEELINDLIAREALKEYLRIGGPVPKIFKRFNFSNDYEKNDFLVRPLYNSLKPLILESLITRNPRLYQSHVGEENNERWCQLVSLLYNEGNLEDKERELHELEGKMFEQYKNSQNPNYEAFYSELESLGYRVRKL